MRQRRVQLCHGIANKQNEIELERQPLIVCFGGGSGAGLSMRRGRCFYFYRTSLLPPHPFDLLKLCR